MMTSASHRDLTIARHGAGRVCCYWLCCLLLGAAARGALAQPAHPPPPIYTIDANETQSSFEAKFLGLITVRGQFSRTNGKLQHDPARRDPAGRAIDNIEAEIDATTLHANVVNAQPTNEILRGAEFFNVEKFPTIRFRSSRFNWEEDKLKSIDGGLTLLGVTRAVTLNIEKSACTLAPTLAPTMAPTMAPPMAPTMAPTSATGSPRARCIADAYVNINRADFGMRGWSASVSNEVKIIVALVAYAESGARVEPIKTEAAGMEPVQKLYRAPSCIWNCWLSPNGDGSSFAKFVLYW